VFSDAIWWRHNKSNMADGRHIVNRILAIFPRFIVRLTRNLVHWSTIMFRHRSIDQINNFRKFKMADGRHFENSFIAISRPGIIRFRWSSNRPIVIVIVQFWFKDGQMLIYKKIMKFKMADSRHIENRILAISPRVIVWLTLYLVCASRTMLRHRPRDENNFRKFKMADGRHFENGFITISQPRIIRFQ